MLKLLVGCRRGNKETFPVPATDFSSASPGERARMYYTPSSQASYNPCSCNCCATYRNDVLEFCLEHAVEILRSTNSNQCIGVCKGREDADPSYPISLTVRQFRNGLLTNSSELSKRARTAMTEKLLWIFKCNEWLVVGKS